MKKVVTFTNYTTEDFIGKWDGVEYTFKAGQSAIYEDGQAKTFARQLGVRECLRKGEDSLNSLSSFMAKAMPEVVETDAKSSKIASDMLNANKDVKEVTDEVDEVVESNDDLDEFEGADEEVEELKKTAKKSK